MIIHSHTRDKKKSLQEQTDTTGTDVKGGESGELRITEMPSWKYKEARKENARKTTNGNHINRPKLNNSKIAKNAKIIK